MNHLISFIVGCALLIPAGAVQAQWVVQRSGIPIDLVDVVMLDSVTAIAVSRNGSVLRTANAGSTWTDMTPPISSIVRWNAVSFFDANNGVVVGDNGRLFTTSSAGITWQLRGIAAGRNCISVLCIGPGRFYVGTDSGWVCKTLDTGRSWTSEKISAHPIRSVFAWRGAFTMGLPLYALTPFSICSTSEFPARAWKETVLPDLAGLGSQAFDAEFSNGGGPGYMVGVQGDLRAAPAILKATTADTIWKNVASGIMRDGELYGVSAPSEKTAYICGSNGMIYKTTDAGVTWIDQSVNIRYSIRAIFFINETRGFAVGDSGLILYCADNNKTGMREIPHAPLRDGITLDCGQTGSIRYAIPERGRATVRLFDRSGRELTTLVDEILERGDYSIPEAQTPLVSGAYLVRLTFTPGTRKTMARTMPWLVVR